MQVCKVLNNNVVISEDSEQREVVVMGKGIGYQKKPGTPIDPQYIEKVFILSGNNDQTLNARYQELLQEIPLEILRVTEQIVNLAQAALPTELHPSVRISLADHIYFAVQRLIKGQQTKNAMLWEIKELYPVEFSIGWQALDLLKQASGVTFQEDEAGFIALHLVNAQLNEDMNNTISVTNLIRDIVQIIKYHLALDIDEYSVEFRRLVTHLKFFAHRLLHKTTISDDDDSLFLSIKTKYPDAFKCVEGINKYIEKNYAHTMTSEEMMFLTIHIERVKRA